MKQERSLVHAKFKCKTTIDKSMDCEGRYIMQKTVNWSLLIAGMTIPVSECALLKALPPKEELQRVFAESNKKKES